VPGGCGGEELKTDTPQLGETYKLPWDLRCRGYFDRELRSRWCNYWSTRWFVVSLVPIPNCWHSSPLSLESEV